MGKVVCCFVYTLLKLAKSTQRVDLMWLTKFNFIKFNFYVCHMILNSINLKCI